MEDAARALAGMKLPSNLDEAYEMAYKVWYVSPLGVGMVLGLLVVGLFKLFSVRTQPMQCRLCAFTDNKLSEARAVGKKPVPQLRRRRSEG